MSDENLENVAIETQEIETKSTEVNVEELLKKMEKLESTNSRLLDESKTNKSKYQETKDKIDSIERLKVEESGTWEEKLELATNEKVKLSGKLAEITKATLKKDLEAKVSRMANDCHDFDLMTDAVLKVGVEYDEDTLSVHGVKDAIEKLRQDKPFLFKPAGSIRMTNAMPSKTENQPLTLSALTPSEMSEVKKLKLQQMRQK